MKKLICLSYEDVCVIVRALYLSSVYHVVLDVQCDDVPELLEKCEKLKQYYENCMKQC